MDREQFGAWALQIVREARPEDTSVLDDDLRVVSTAADGKQQSISIQNIWADYIKCRTDEERERVLRRVRYLAGILDTGESFDERRVLLMPRIRPRDFFEVAIARGLAAMSEEAAKEPPPPDRPFATHLGVGLAFDLPEHIEYVTDPTDLPAPVDELFEMALANLRRATKHGLTEAKDGLWIGDWGDEFAAERMLLPGMFEDIPGNPLVFLPGAERIYVIQAGASKESLAQVLALVDERLSRPRSLLSYGVVHDFEEGWQVWDELGYESPLMSERLTDSLAGSYAAQKESAEKRGDTEFYATVMGLARKRGEPAATMCSWTKGQDALLPRTHLITLLDPDLGEPIVVTWGTFQRRAKECLEMVPDLYPPRYRTVKFPPRELLIDWIAMERAFGADGAPRGASTPRAGTSEGDPPLHEPEPRETPEPAWTRFSPRLVALILIALAVLYIAYRAIEGIL